MSRLTRQQVIDGRGCPACKALPGERCKAVDGGYRSSVHLIRFPKSKRDEHAGAKQVQKDNREAKYLTPHPVRDNIRDKTECPRCTAKRGEYCHDRKGKMRLELHAPRWRVYDALPPPEPQPATLPIS